MSWAAHDLEGYVFQRHLSRGVRISFVAFVIGSWGPDLLTKWFVYGVDFGGINLGAGDPTVFARGWPGAGMTHSLAFGVAIGGLVYLLTRSRAWAIGLMLGIWAHVISDMGDTVGVMLFFPFSTMHVALGAWAFASQHGRIVDGAAYYSGPALVWDGLWVILSLACFPILKREYFRDRIVPVDGFWAWAGRYLPEDGLLAIYRGAIFYGVCRFVAWMLWAHVLNNYAFDISWGGPHWVQAAHLP